MALYRAYITTGRAPALSCSEIERPSIRGVVTATKAELRKAGIDWPELELPRGLKPGHYFRAQRIGADVEIYKIRA